MISNIIKNQSEGELLSLILKQVNYFRTWFFLDLIAALPFDVLHAFSDLMVRQQYIIIVKMQMMMMTLVIF